ncbi:MAG: cyclic nucleotide-binding domain-containing protein [Chloroflexi bacterium]|nr:cyclic nucleotide-binding domain-containing protein [Chloroflexota bacterium]
MSDRYVDVLKTVDIFSGLGDEELSQISELIRPKVYQPGQVICHQGDEGDALYILEDGRVKISTTDRGGNEKILAYIGPGQFAGEMALLTGQPRSATLTSVTETTILVLRKDEYDRLISSNLAVMREMMRVIAQRQAESNVRLAREEKQEAKTIEAKIITVFSPKGGSGKSTIAVNLAAHMATRYRGESVMLVDMAVTFGHDALMLNLKPKQSLANNPADALSSPDGAELLDATIMSHRSNLNLIVGATKPEEGDLVNGDTVRAAINHLRTRYNYIIFDTPSTFAEVALAAVEASDVLVLVTTPEITSLRDIKECQRILLDVVQFPKDKVRYVLNNIFAYKALGKDEFDRALGQHIAVEIPYGGDIPTRAALAGEPFVLNQPDAPVTKAIEALAKQIVTAVGGSEPEAVAAAPARKKKGWFFGLF